MGEASDRLAEIGSADIVLGVPTYNHADSIGGVLEAAQTGFARYLSSYRSVIVLADAGSQDGTLERAEVRALNGVPVVPLSYRLHPAYPFAVAYDGFPSKGSAVRASLAAARQLGARACAIVGGNLQSVTPEWTPALFEPIVAHEVDFVSPVHARHKHEGVLTTGIVYPLLRALYGRRIREPLGGECALSARLVDYCLSHGAWDSVSVCVGIDTWLPTQAVCAGFRVAEVGLGPRKHLPPPALEPSEVLAQVLGPVFAEMETQAGVWQRVRGSVAVARIGPAPELWIEDGDASVESMLEAWRLGHQSLQQIWGMILTPASLVELKRVARAAADQFRLSDPLWARVVYDFSLAYRLRLISRDHLLRAMTPLYLGWVASFLLETRHHTPAEVEHRVERLCLAYEAEKPYLISRWRWPDRFNP